MEHVRRQINGRYGLSVAGVTQQALGVLRGHSWPGNVREREAVLEEAMIFQSGGGWVRVEDLRWSAADPSAGHRQGRRLFDRLSEAMSGCAPRFGGRSGSDSRLRGGR